MPKYPCAHGFCLEIVAARGDRCAKHAGASGRSERDRRYDLFSRDADAKKFYASVAWQNARRWKLTETPICEQCPDFATEVHHRKKLRDCTIEQRIDQRMLMSVCKVCHPIVEAELEKCS